MTLPNEPISNAERLERALSDGDNYAQRTPLQKAVRKGEVAEVLRLLAQGAALEERDSRDWTALYIAVQFRRAQLVQILLDHGADPNAITREGPDNARSETTPLMRAIVHANVPVAELLISRGADVNLGSDWWQGKKYSPLALAHEQVHSLEAIADDLLFVSVDDDGTEHPSTYEAHRKEQQDMIELLLKNGAQLNAKDD